MRVKILLLSLMVFSITLFGQRDARIAKGTKSLDQVEKMVMPTLDNEALVNAELARRGPGIAPRFAENINVSVTPNTHGDWETLPDGNAVWRLRIFSEGAKSLNLGFTRFYMPETGSLILYTPSLRNALGPFTPADNEVHEQLWTPIVPGEELVIEVKISNEQKSNLELELTSVNHDFMGFSNMLLSGSCNLDVVCGAADGWPQVDENRDIIRSVAVMSLGGGTFCTGFLVNNARQDCTPYFMTAAHCGINSGNAPSLVTFWNYQNSFCRQPNTSASGGPGNGQLVDFNAGAIWRASYDPSDMTLVELDDPVSETANTFFAGWSAENVAPSSAICVHHPSTDEKRISFEFDPLSIGSWTGTPNSHVIVNDWDIGTTEPGSSGSPLFDQNKRVVGQLSGGGAACGNDLSDLYGRVFMSWEGGGSANSRLRNWLDPDNTGVLVIDGRESQACGFTVEVSPAEQEVCAPDNATYTVTVSENFTSDVTLSLTGVPVGASADFDMNPIAPGSSTTLIISNTGAATAGIYDIIIQASDASESVNSSFSLAINDGIPVAPSLTTPLDGETDVSTILDFEWSAGGEGTTFEFELATDMDFTNIVESGTDISGNMINVVNLNPVTTYYWRVRGSSICGTGEWSAVFSFTTANIACSSHQATDVPIMITDVDVNTIRSFIEVPDNGSITDVNVSVNIEHTWVGDLDVTLVAPSGARVELFSRPGVPETNFGCGGDNIIVTFDDDAAEPYDTFEGTCDDAPAISGTFQPLEALSAFTGELAVGTWTLIVVDNFAEDGGALASWSLEVCKTPDFSLVASEERIDVCVNEIATYSLTLGEDFDPAGVNMSADGLPDGTTATFTPNPATPGSAVEMVVSGAASGGSFIITVNASDGVSNGAASLELNVLDVPQTIPALSSPADGATETLTNPVFEWSAGGVGDGYDIEISLDSDFATIASSAADLTEPSLSGENLNPGSTYYWRVRLTNICGSGSWSDTFSFTTGFCSRYAATDVPVVIGDGAADSYTSQIEVSRNALITDINIIGLRGFHTWINDMTFDLTSPSGTNVLLIEQQCGDVDDFDLSLDDGGLPGPLPCPYTDGNNYEPAGSLADFNGEGSGGTWILTLTDNANQDGGTLEAWTLEICAVPDHTVSASAGEVAVCVDESGSFSVDLGADFDPAGVNLDVSGAPTGAMVEYSENPAAPGSSVTITLTGITGGQEGSYPLTVTANDGTNMGTAEVTLIVLGLPAAVTTPDPADGATGVAVSGAVLNWEAIAGANAYTVEVASDPDFNNILDSASGLDNTYTLAADLDFETTYYWRVTAENDCGGTVSATFSFTSAADTSLGVDPGEIAVCSGEAGTFQLTIGGGFGENVNLSADGLPMGATATFSSNPASPGSTVMVTISNLVVAEDMSFDLTFTADDGSNTNTVTGGLTVLAPPAVPGLSQPADGQTNVAVLPDFSWVDVSNADSYLLEVSTDEMFVDLVVSTTVGSNSYSITEELDALTTYFWRVSAINDCGGSLSETFNFTTEDTDGVQDLDGRTVSILPNPTSGLLQVAFSAPFGENVSVSVFSVNGTLLQEFIMENQQTRLDVNLGSYAPGVYFVRVVARDEALTDRIILQK